MAIYLIRHGESEGNFQEYFQGTIDSALTEQGEAQARILGRWLKARQVTPAAIYSSPLKRAFRTAELVAEELGAPPPIPAPEIAEYAAGALEGLTMDAVQARFPEYLDRPLDQRGDFTAFSGESYEAMQQRLGKFIEHVQRQHAEDDILAVAHGGSLYQLLKLWCGWPTPRHYFTRIGNCCCFKLGLRELPEGVVGELRWMVPLELMA